MTAAPSHSTPEQQARRDYKELQHPGDHNHVDALKQITQHAHTLGLHDLRAEQRYWNSLSKDSHNHLPGLELHHGADGNVDSAKTKGGAELYNRESELKNAEHNYSSGIGKGAGPYSAFRAEGMNDHEAKEAARKVRDMSGQTSFKQGEKFKVNEDGSVTSKVEHHGVVTEETHRPDKSVTTRVEHKDGKYTETTKDKDGNETKRDGDKNSYTETAYDAHHNLVSTTKRIEQPDGKFAESTSDKDHREIHTRIGDKNGYTDTTYGAPSEKVGPYGSLSLPTQVIEHKNGQNGSYTEDIADKVNNTTTHRTVDHKPDGTFNRNDTVTGPDGSGQTWQVNLDSSGKNGTGTMISYTPNMLSGGVDQMKYKVRVVDGKDKLDPE